MAVHHLVPIAAEVGPVGHVLAFFDVGRLRQPHVGTALRCRMLEVVVAGALVRQRVSADSTVILHHLSVPCVAEAEVLALVSRERGMSTSVGLSPPAYGLPQPAVWARRCAGGATHAQDVGALASERLEVTMLGICLASWRQEGQGAVLLDNHKRERPSRAESARDVCQRCRSAFKKRKSFKKIPGSCGTHSTTTRNNKNDNPPASPYQCSA